MKTKHAVKLCTLFSKISFSLLILCFPARAQNMSFTGAEANKICQGSSLVSYNEYSSMPSSIVFGENTKIKSESTMSFLSQVLQFKNGDELVEYKIEHDKLGYTHHRYQQYYNGIKVENGQYLVHEKNGMIYSVNGVFIDRLQLDVLPNISTEFVIQVALKDCNAIRYKWEMPQEELLIKEIKSDSLATYFPKLELVIVARNFDYKNHELHLCYKMDIYADLPMSKYLYYIDVSTGEIIAKENQICGVDAPATGNTLYNGVRPIITDSFALNTYRLRELTRGLGIETYDMNTSTNYGTAVDFINNSTVWNTASNFDRAAYDAHWGAESTYDYYFNVHGRNSLDGAGLKLRNYVHYDVNWNNAYWNGSVMSFGDGTQVAGGCNPLVSLDICGHELTHGLDFYTAHLLYVNESGALNESFSDIFGISIEFNITPGQADWTLGEDVMVTPGQAFRNLANPNAYGQPDTYLGTNWHSISTDQGGVHINSGVQNYWYYLLCAGGAGINDIGSNYNVTGIGIADAEKIAYRNLTVYMTSFSNYADARAYSIQAAQDLFGACSQQVISTTNAWYAVGVGPAYSATIDADFTVNATNSCSLPFTVNFTNTSVHATSASWNFGDGDVSNIYNPTHVYTTPGTYTVQLTSGSSCGPSDQISYSSLITISTPTPPTVNGDSACTPSSLNLSANGSGTLEWFTVPIGGVSINTGNNFVTPVLGTTTTYYIQDQIPGTTGFCGIADTSAATSANYGNVYEANMIFDVLQPCTLKTVQVCAYNAGLRNITLRDNAGNTLQDTTVNLPLGTSIINLNFPLEAATGYRLGGDTLSLKMDFMNINYPYNLNGVASITGYTCPYPPVPLYLFFYNWEFETMPCLSLRTPVDAYIWNISTPTISGVGNILSSSSATGNQWYLNGSLILGATTQDYTVLQNGNYTVEVTDVHGCTAVSGINTFSNLGIEDGVENNIIYIYPNPNKGIFRINAGDIVQGKIQIFNTLGQMIHQTSDILNEINLSTQPKGTYYLRLFSGEKIYSQKIILQ